MDERICPDALCAEELVTLVGYERAFHKVSWVRGCHPGDALLQVSHVPESFKAPERNLSLVLGLRPHARSNVVGYLQTYPSELATEVLQKLDAREGFDPNRPTQELAYLRRSCVVKDEDGRSIKALTYFTNPMCNKVLDTLTMEEQAAILAAATAAPLKGHKSRGLFYLEGVRCALRAHGRRDQNLEALARCAYKWYHGRLNLHSPEP